MLRGAEILFSAIFAVTFLKRALNKLHYCGITGCLVGICMVGASSLLSPSGGGSSDTGMVLLGMGLIVVAQVRLPQPSLLHCSVSTGATWDMLAWASQKLYAAPLYFHQGNMSHVDSGMDLRRVWHS